MFLSHSHICLRFSLANLDLPGFACCSLNLDHPSFEALVRAYVPSSTKLIHMPTFCVCL